MTPNELVSLLKQNGAQMAPTAGARALELAQNALQQMRAAVLPKTLTDFYGECGGVRLGDAYIFGPAEIAQGAAYPVPDIILVNREITNIAALRGKTVFGRNGLFWFACDAFGNFYMLDNVTGAVLRKYDDLSRAMNDCLAVGKL
jgi:hypothetical protein